MGVDGVCVRAPRAYSSAASVLQSCTAQLVLDDLDDKQTTTERR